MKQMSNKHLWKRGMALGLSFAMTATLIPAVPAQAAARDASAGITIPGTTITKAGSVKLNGTATGQPFAAGTVSSQNFRAPAIMTMDDGSLLAVAEADWTGTERMNGTDIITSVSKDGGTTWENYTFPFYFPDSSGYNAEGAATFSTPSIVEGPDGQVYCFVNVYPTGGNSSKENHLHGKGYIHVDGKLRMAVTDSWDTSNSKEPSDNNNTEYAYYIGDFAEDGDGTYAPIANRSDYEPTEYYVDAWYNLYKKSGNDYIAENKDGKQQNIYYSSSDYHVFNVGYTWMVASEDYGKSWGDPINITDQINDVADDDVRLISSGRGTTMQETGEIVLGMRYHNNHGDAWKLGAGIISSGDNGKTWEYANGVAIQNTGDPMTGQNKIVELEDGTLRMFFSNTQDAICYVDAAKGDEGYTFTERVKTDALLNGSEASRCNLSAFAYSKKVDGKQLVLVSAPKGERLVNGRIFAFLVQDDENKTMKLVNEFAIPDAAASFQYSCMTELDDGSVGILWESKNGNNYSVRYDRLSIIDIVPEQDIKDVTVSVDLKVGEAYERAYLGSKAPEAPEAQESDVAVVETGMTVGAVTANVKVHTNNSSLSFESNDVLKNIADAECVFGTDSVYNEKSKSYLAFNTYIFEASPIGAVTFTPVTENGKTRFKIKKTNANRCFFFHTPWMNFNMQGGDPPTSLILLRKKKSMNGSSDFITGYERVSKITPGEKYLIAYVDESTDNPTEIYLCDPSIISTNKATWKIDLSESANSVTTPVGDKIYVKIAAEKAGVQKIVLDGVTYIVNVTSTPDALDGVSVKQAVGQTVDKGWLESHVAEAKAEDSVASVQIKDKIKVPLYQKATTNDNDKAYSTTDLNLDIEDAECVFTKTSAGENTWSIYNQKIDSYYMNTGSGKFFHSRADVNSADKDKILVTPVTNDGEVSFKIQRYNEASARKLFFHYSWASFATQGNGTPTPCVEELLLLQKKDTVADDDLIKGYERATEISDGGKYLIACYAATTNGGSDYAVYVLYPDATSIPNQVGNVMTKKVGTQTTESRLFVTSKAKGCTQLTAGATKVNIQVTDNSAATPIHLDEILEQQHAVGADCNEQGYTNKVCRICGEVLKADVTAEEHTWTQDENGVTPLTVDSNGIATTNGSITYTCDCGSHKKIEILHKYAYNYLTKQIEDATEFTKDTESDEMVDVKTALAAAQTAHDASNHSIAMYKAAVELKEAMEDYKAAIEGQCVCEVTAIANTPASPQLNMKADGTENTLTLKPQATVSLKGCTLHTEEKPAEPSFSYRMQNAGTTGATVNPTNGTVTALASGQAVVEVSGTINGKTHRQNITVKVVREGQLINDCICTVGDVTVAGTLKIDIDAADVSGSNKLTLAPNATVKSNSCGVTGHPDGNKVAYRYTVKDAGTTGAEVAANGVVTAQNAGTVIVTVTAVLDCGATKSRDVEIVVTAKGISKAGSVSGTSETVTTNQPFVPGEMAGRNYFSAPAFIVKEKTDNKGMLVAAADAKYDTQVRRAGGMDIVASVSTNNGVNWTYSFPFYFPDSGENAQQYATTINNPQLAEGADGTIYCMANVSPTGVTSMVSGQNGYKYPNPGTGYIEVGQGQEKVKRLALTSDYDKVNENPAEDDNAENYEYYVGDFADNGYAPVIRRSNNTASDYAVDAWYNLYKKVGDGYEAITQYQATSAGITGGKSVVQQNVFYAGSELHVYNTSYVMYVTSSDGLSWGDPVILNPVVKKDDEQTMIVSSGKGLLTTFNRLVFPVYSRTQTEDGLKDVSSIIWLADDGWHRSNNVPSGTDITNSSNGEVIEISNGGLRLMFRNKTGMVCYADASRDENNIFTFENPPVMTEAAAYMDANVSAVKYSKTVNGRQAILVATPSENALSNGKIHTFLGTAEYGDDNKEIAREVTYDVKGSSNYFGDSCLVLQDDGNQVGLLWENSGGGVRYSRFGIMDVVKDRYIPDVAIDVTLLVGGTGGTYTRTYTAEAGYLTELTQPTPIGTASATLDEGEEIMTKTVALYKRGTTTDTATTFETLDESVDIVNAEFTFMQPDNSEADTYVVYSEGAGMYFTLYQLEGNIFLQEFRNTIQFTPQDGKFKISRITSNVPGKENEVRTLLFNPADLSLNAWSGSSTGWSNTLNGTFSLLEKIPDDPDEDLETEEPESAESREAVNQPVPGYQTVDTITPGRKYLVAQIIGDAVYIVYPNNSYTNSIRKTGELRDVTKAAKRTVTINALAKGTATMTVDHVTYRITCEESTIEMPVNGRKFFTGAVIGDNTYIEDTSIASFEEGSANHGTLCDHSGNKTSKLDAYNDSSIITNMNELNLTPAEFTIEAKGDGYTLYNELTENYLMNTSAKFGKTEVVQTLTEGTGNDKGSFNIHVTYNSKERYYVYHYPFMQFDGYQGTGDTDGGYYFEFLEKQDRITDQDTIPGYKKVDKITSGRTYLITESYNQNGRNVFFIAYPYNTAKDQSKMYEVSADAGVWLVAKGRVTDNAKVRVGEFEYELTLTAACTHGTSFKKWYEGYEAATCTEAGVTGVEYCLNCYGKVSDSTVIDALGHNVSEWTIDREVALDQNGERSGVCERCGETITEPISRDDFVLEKLNEEIAKAQKIVDNKASGDYSEQSIISLEAALNAAKALGEDSTTDARAQAVIALQAVEINRSEAFEASRTEFKVLFDELTAAKSDTQNYSDAVRAALETAMADIKTVDEYLTKADLEEALDKLKAAKAALKTKDEEAKEKELENLIEELKAKLSQTDIYTPESLAELKKALDEVEEMTITETNIQDAIDILNGVTLVLIGGGDEETQKQQYIEEIQTMLAGKELKDLLTAGQGSYTKDSWDAFIAAYNAMNLSEEALKKMSLADLQKLIAGLKNAQKNLQSVTYVTSVKFAQSKYQIAKGKSVDLTKEITLKTPENASNQTLTWKSSDTNIATVSVTGVVKTNKKAAKKTATITAVNAAGATVASVQVKVMNGNVSKVKANGKKSLTVKAGKKVTLKAKVTVKGKKPYNNKLKWTSSNPNVATVSTKLATSMKVTVAKNAKKGAKAKITAISTDGTNKKIVFTIKVK